ncbi:MAG: DUF6916 family protein [Salipiger thiooxidans]|uniref:DUF6916 family protein n=1 Tax=Salipiger thiooxidans TaxID=282683 RepID=UPI001A8F12E1|nr:hypothetical protein [Salipiger thiooxidans]MBN8189622.1 hypothetical protein [Salipiger thiooxidans]MBR9840449.1 hypothetical protein [Paracoccaceae bacterium]MCA0850441.1 hypothetical protein [Salipiger thiooxidans]
MAVDLITASPETFEAYIGDSFHVETEAGPVSLTLDNIKRFEKSDIRDNELQIGDVLYPPRKAFALTFEGPTSPVLMSATIKLTHASLGQIHLFLSPFRLDRDCALYEAVFN